MKGPRHWLRLPRFSLILVSLGLSVSLPVMGPRTVVAASELDRVQGEWQVVELAENGRVVAAQDVRHWLPSGGRVEIIQNTIIFKSQHDGKKYAKVFSFDPTTYPKQIQIYVGTKIEGWGIYEFDQGKLVICVSSPEETPRPTEFAAPAGSRRTLMVLQRPGASQPIAGGSPLPGVPAQPGRQPVANPPVPQPTSARTPNLVNLPPPPGVAGAMLTDDQVRRMLVGSWRMKDSFGAMICTFAVDGGFQTIRETEELRTFQRIFVQTPLSTGTWSVSDGRLTASVTTSAAPDRMGRAFQVHVRSITNQDMIFVDALGRVGAATRVR